MPTESLSVGAFLRARREAMQPEDVGVVRGPHRRVPGLRREEVARLAGISPEYYLRLEQGHDHQPSGQVLAALGRALRLDNDGHRYLHRLAYPPPRASPMEPVEAPVALQALLSQWTGTPAYLCDRHHDVLAANDLAVAMAPGAVTPGLNLLMQVFTEVPRGPHSAGWEQTAASLVASLRFYGDLTSPRLQEIVGELSIRSADFRRLWASHEARPLVSGRAPTYVDPLGWFDFRWQHFEVPGDAGHHVTVFFGDAGSPEVSAIAYLSARARETAPATLPATLPADPAADPPRVDRQPDTGGRASRNCANAARDASSVGRRITSVSS